MAIQRKAQTDGQPMATVELSVPWAAKDETYLLNYALCLNREEFVNFVHERTELHKVYIIESERTRRILLILASILVALSVIIPIFAPNGRETISYAVGLALFVLSAGAAGYSVVKLSFEKKSLVASRRNKSDA